MKKKTYLSLVALYLLLTGLNGQVIKPYLQSPTDTSVWISWKTSSGTESKVICGTDSTALSRQVFGNCEILSDVGYDNNYFYHSVRLTGLEPEQFYYYRIITGALQSDIYRFRTQPPAGTKPGVYRVLIFGDHQIKGNTNYESLMNAAREKVFEKYGGTVEEHINLVLNDGDQVDAGTLDQYEHVHFGPSSVLSGNLPIMTTLGNHEFYGSIGVNSYYPHFFYDDLGYKGIVSPGGEDYYSYQEGNIVFLHMSSENITPEQVSWVQQVVDSVKADTGVNWLVGLAHRPINAEQFVGDISEYIRDEMVPILAQTKKSAILVTGHHHLYARGQVRDYPMYHIISGAASWDQFWGQSVEKDFDDVQKTIDFWTYQIATFDNVKNEMSVESYAIGSPKLGLVLGNELVDSFYRKPGLLPPAKPSIINATADSVDLPYVLISSPYSSAVGEPFNSTQFQVSSDSNFSILHIDKIRDFENLYGTTGYPAYLPVDINLGLDIFSYEIGRNKLPNGTYFARTRHRDRNIEWSEWSDAFSFSIWGSVPGFTSISTPKSVFKPNEDILVSYLEGPGNPYDWIGIYKEGNSPGPIPSDDWEYVSGSSGTVVLNISEQGKYFIAFFENEGYEELCDRITVYVRDVPQLSLGKAGYAAGENIEASYSEAPGLLYDWLGIYRINDVPGSIGSTLWEYTSGNSGTISFPGLPAGYYFICYFLEDGYSEACERLIFSVGSDLSAVSTDQAAYSSLQSINVSFQNGPGTALDWIGIFRQNAPPGTAPLVTRKFIANQESGSVTFDAVPEPGEYYAAMCINNSSIRISNKANFSVAFPTSALNPKMAPDDFTVYPSPSTGWIRVGIAKTIVGDFTLKMVSLHGTLVLEKLLHTGNTGHSEMIELNGVPPGMYLVNIQSQNQVVVKKLILN